MTTTLMPIADPPATDSQAIPRRARRQIAALLGLLVVASTVVLPANPASAATPNPPSSVSYSAYQHGLNVVYYDPSPAPSPPLQSPYFGLLVWKDGSPYRIVEGCACHTTFVGGLPPGSYAVQVAAYNGSWSALTPINYWVQVN